MRRLLLSVTMMLAAGLLAFPDVQGQAPVFSTGSPAELAIARTMGLGRLRAAALQRGIDDELVVSDARVDALSMAHTRVQQRVRGVPVWGGEAIAHFRRDGTPFTETDNLLEDINVDVTPRITPAAAIAAATTDFGCSDCLTAAPTADLWIMRDEGRDYLVYRVSMRRLDGTNDTALPVRFIDAHDGHIVSAYDNLQTGTGNSYYSGTVTIGTSFNNTSGQYYLENLVRRVGTFDIRNLPGGSVFRFVDPDDVWNGATERAGVDAHFASERYLDYLHMVHGRNGIDGAGGPFWANAHDSSGGLISSIVHFGSDYNNAFWDGSVMVYGDGDGVRFSPLVSIDIGGHEMTHGVTQFTAALIYQGESGALNESWSDVIGEMLERHVKGASINNWLVGEETFTPGISGDALRYMDDPHRAANAGFTLDDDPDHYTERYTGPLDNGGVHINSGIANKAIYLLAQGGAHHLGGSMTGIGADAAARIWFVALSSYMTSSTTFLQARTATVNAAAALYGADSTQQIAVSSAWCLVGVGACGVPTADSSTPNAGSGFTQLFTLQYSDSQGATNLTTAWVWFNATVASAANSCLVHYARATNSINLLNDSGTTWLSAALGSATTLQNSQCAIAVASSGASPSGTTLRVNVAMTFKTSFAGAKNIYLYSANGTSANSGWQDRGDWTVPTVAAPVTADSVTPSSGSGATQAFALQYSDSLGAADLMATWVWFSNTLAGSADNSCLAYYDRPGNRVFLLNDSGTAWMSGLIGSATTLQNLQCSIALVNSSASPSGSTLTVTLAMTFSAVYNGTKNVYLYATNGSFNSGWHDRGDWTVPGVAVSVTADAATPSSGSGSSQSFALAYSSAIGATNLTMTWVWFNATLAGPASNSCLAYYDRSAATVLLLNDAGTAWSSGLLGSATTLQNGQCSISLADSNALPSGNTLTLTLAMTFQPAFSGAKNIFLYATNGTQNSGWQDRGDWTVPGGGDAVTADSATPAFGVGSAQSFALNYSSTLGATNLSATWVWFSATLAPSAVNSCLAYYDRPAHVVALLNDSATAWLSQVMGSATTIQNSQCAIALGSSSATPSGNTLTVTLAMTFVPGFGTKNIYLYASNGVANSGWQDRGDWTVP